MPLSATELVRQAELAFGRRESLMTFWQDTADNFYPERADFTVSKTLGESFASNLYDSNPPLYRRDLCNWIGATIRPKGRPWFEYRARDEKVNERQRVKVFLTDRTQTTRNLLYDQKSQFISAVKQGDHDWATFGNAVESVEDRSDREGLLIKAWHLRDCAWEDDPDGVTHKMWRKYKISAENIVLRGKTQGWTVPPAIQKLVDDRNGSTMVDCMHIVMPADLYDMPRQKRKGMEWVSIHVSTDRGKMGVLQERMRPIFNYSVSRWFRLDSSPYAFSPCVCTSIPDARTIQAMMWSIIEAGELAVNPPLAAVKEAVLGGVEWYSGGITWLDGKYDEKTGEAFRVMETGKQPQLGLALRESLRQVMGDAWYLNKLFMPPPQTQPMTAEEASLRNAEYLRVSQPIIEPAEPERNGRLLDIVTAMAQHLGYWGNPDELPDELKGQDVDFAYDNPIEDARRIAKTQAYSQALGLATSSDAIDPALKANVDWQGAFREAISGIAPPKWLLPEQDAKKAVVQGQQAQQVQRAGDQMGQVIGAAGAAADANHKTAQAEKLAAETRQLQPAA